MNIFLMVTLLAGNIGFTVNKHYCHGKLADVTLMVSSHCGCDDDAPMGNCCREESETFRLDQDYQVSPANFVPQSLITFIKGWVIQWAQPLLTEHKNTVISYWPPGPDVALHKVISVYLI